MNPGVLPLAASSIRARRRPRAVVAVWAWQSVVAWLAAWPVVALVRAAYGHSPFGDASLWDAGSLPLLGLVSRDANGVSAATGAAVMILVAGAVAGLVPLAALMITLGSTTSSAPEGGGVGAARSVAGAVRAFRPLGLLLLGMTLLQGLAVALAVFFGEMTEAWTHGWLGEARAQQLGIAVGALTMTCALVVGVVHDLARAAVVRFDFSAVHALLAGSQTFRAAPGTVLWSWAWRALASLVPVFLVAVFAGVFGGRTGGILWLLAGLHQAVILERVALRASWLAKALRVIDNTRHAVPSFADESVWSEVTSA